MVKQPQVPPPEPPPHDLEGREEMMKRDVLLVATAGASLLNGMHFSPFFDPVAILLRPFIAGTFLGTPLLSLYLTSIFISVMTLLIAGIPVAIYERTKALTQSNATSLGIWLAVTLLLTVPSLMGLLGSR
jgi:hypothetical protein